MMPNGWKDCSDCTIPHFDYKHIIKKLVECYEAQLAQESEFEEPDKSTISL